MRPLDVAHGMGSRVTPIHDHRGVQVAAAWTRTLRGSGRHAFSGRTPTRTLPGADRPSVHVAFPLESGNVQVFLRPSVVGDGGLLLESPRGRFGEDGAYVVVRDAATTPPGCRCTRRFHMYVDPDGVLRTDHELRLWSARRSGSTTSSNAHGDDPQLPPRRGAGVRAVPVRWYARRWPAVSRGSTTPSACR